MSASVNRYVVILSAIALVVLLFFAPHKPSATASVTEPVAELNAPVKLPPDQQKMYEGLKFALDNSVKDEDKQRALEALAEFFQQNKKPVQVAVYYQKLAELKNTAAAWMEAGERFYKAAGFAEDAQVAAVYQNAISSYGKVLLIEKDNTQAKIKMGVCYVEMGADPMKGIGLIREVADKDPKNIDAQLNLGFFAVKSKQFDKAIIRFNNVLKIDTGYADANVYLANTYEMMGDTANALTWYEAYRKQVKDTVISNEVGNYIKKLKGNKNIKN
jgi:tetratricopeptide (TPR) repeat protein